jgi:hypothetical protein
MILDLRINCYCTFHDLTVQPDCTVRTELYSSSIIECCQTNRLSLKVSVSKVGTALQYECPSSRSAKEGASGERFYVSKDTTERQFAALLLYCPVRCSEDRIDAL